MRLLSITTAILIAIGMASCKQGPTKTGTVKVSLEFGQIDNNGELKLSDKQTIEYNFNDPSISRSKKLEVGTAINSATKEEVSTITQTGVGSNPIFPVHFRIVSRPGYAFFHALKCYVYGTVLTDTETGASWFVAADLATQSTMNNCNYGNVV